MVFWFGLIFAIAITSTIIFILWPIIEKPWVARRMRQQPSSAEAAIVLVHKYPSDSWILYSNGLIWLGLWLQRMSLSYFITTVTTKSRFSRIVADDTVQYLFVFGHGKRYGLYFGESFLNYADLKGTKKKFVGQYHCNIGDGFFGCVYGGEKTLADVTEAETQDITYWFRFSFVNNVTFLLSCLFKKTLW